MARQNLEARPAASGLDPSVDTAQGPLVSILIKAVTNAHPDDLLGCYYVLGAGLIRSAVRPRRGAPGTYSQWLVLIDFRVARLLPSAIAAYPLDMHKTVEADWNRERKA